MWDVVPFVIWQEGESAAISIFEKLGRDRGENSNFFDGDDHDGCFDNDNGGVYLTKIWKIWNVEI